MIKDDNDRLRAGVLPSDHRAGTRLLTPLPAAEALPADPRERLRTAGLSLPELLQIEFPPTVWIVEGLIQEDSTHCFFGPPNSGKTFLAIDVILKALAAGKRVLFYEAEGSGRDLQLRLRRALAAHEVQCPEGLRVFHNAEIDLTSEAGLAAVLAHARVHNPDLIVFDSLAAMAGDIDENEAAAMIHLANVLNRIKAEFCSVLTLHHMTKEGWGGETPSLKTLRGHGSLPGRLDVAIAVVAVEDQTTESELVFDIFEVKRRDEPKLKQRRCSVAMPKAGEAARLRMGELDQSAMRADAAQKRREQVGRQMIDALNDAMPTGLLTTELRELVAGSSGDKSEALRHLLNVKKVGRLAAKKGERTGRLVLRSAVVAEPSDAE